jgi:penicillin-binding protein 2
MDVRTGEMLALTSYPEYDQNVVTAGEDKQEIARLLKDPGKPFLNRAVSGLYTPGSIVKPIVALGALAEGVIDPMKRIFSSGALTLPNPYNPDKPSVFKDWKAHGWMTMRDAIAVSSDVYFYEVGGGFQDQPGLGISKLDQYFNLFGMAEPTGIDLPAEAVGFIATPEWKAKNFPDDPDWRLGNTYITAIGQYGTQVTPLAAVRWVAALSNGGELVVPSVLKGGHTSPETRVLRKIELPQEELKIVLEGMRQGVTTGVAAGLNTPAVKIAAKSGTAELGVKKDFVNSWITGFFPYESPRYAFAIIMEHGPVSNTTGATFVMRQVIDWMALNAPEYLK